LLGSAYAEFQEKEKGSITAGKLADMVLLSDDALNIDPVKIRDVRVLKTWLGGKLWSQNASRVVYAEESDRVRDSECSETADRGWCDTEPIMKRTLLLWWLAVNLVLAANVQTK
jgi:hypothetical protein